LGHFLIFGRLDQLVAEVSVLALPDGATLRLFDGFPARGWLIAGGVSAGRRRVKPLRGSSASLRPFG